MKEKPFDYNKATIISNDFAEPVSEDLEEEIKRFAYTLPHTKTGSIKSAGWVHGWRLESVIQIGKHIANWQKEQMIDKSCEWLSKRVFDYDGNFLDDFRKAMEGQP